MSDRERKAIEDRYADLLPTDRDDEMVGLLAQLDAACTASPPGRWLATPPTIVRLANEGWPRPRRRPPLSLRPLLLTLAALVITAGVVVAASGILNLGKPTTDVPSNQFFPLSGFRRMAHPLHGGSRVEVMVLTVNGLFPTEAIERWPVVKALEQFGTITNIHPKEPTIYKVKILGHEVLQPPTLATFDWSMAHYRSPYVVFVHKDAWRYDPGSESMKPFQPLTRAENKLVDRYGKVGGKHVIGGPLVAIDNYAQYQSQTLFESDFRAPVAPPGTPTTIGGPLGAPLSFATIQTALETGKDPPETSLIEDTNAETNVMIALICHGDGGKPASVCGRPAIRHLLKHVK